MLVLQSPDNLLDTLISGCENTLKYLPLLFATYSIFIPLTKILEKGGATKGLERVLHPINKRLFPLESENCYKFLSINVSTNLLGIGGASTPSGIKAIENMKSRKNKLTLVVMNALSIQIIPTTVLALRASHHGVVNVILPTIITTTISTLLGVVLVKVFCRE